MIFIVTMVAFVQPAAGLIAAGLRALKKSDYGSDDYHYFNSLPASVKAKLKYNC